MIALNTTPIAYISGKLNPETKPKLTDGSLKLKILN